MPEIDTSEKNVIGGLNMFIENVALAMLSVFPTIIALYITPWKLVPLLVDEEPDGRRGVLLCAGIFFVASITVTMLIASLFVTNETLAFNTGLIGPAYAKNISAAVSAGDIWQLASLIGPVYILAMVFGSIACCLTRLTGPRWTLRTGLRAGFYQMAGSISWIIISSAIIDTIRLVKGSDISSALYTINSIPILFLPFWQYVCFFRHIGKLSAVKAVGLGVLQVLMMVSAIVLLSIIFD